MRTGGTTCKQAIGDSEGDRGDKVIALHTVTVMHLQTGDREGDREAPPARRGDPLGCLPAHH